MAAAGIGLPALAHAAPGRTLPAVDLDTLEAIIAAAARANDLRHGEDERAQWRDALREAFAGYNEPQRDAVLRTCDRLRRELGADEMSTAAGVDTTRSALRGAIALRSPRERAFEQRLIASLPGMLDGPTDLKTWLEAGKTRIAARVEELEREYGEHPAAVDPRTGEPKYGERYATEPRSLDPDGILDPTTQQAMTRNAASAGLTLAQSVLTGSAKALLKI